MLAKIEVLAKTKRWTPVRHFPPYGEQNRETFRRRLSICWLYTPRLSLHLRHSITTPLDNLNPFNRSLIINILSIIDKGNRKLRVAEVLHVNKIIPIKFTTKDCEKIKKAAKDKIISEIFHIGWRINVNHSLPTIIQFIIYLFMV